jgi:hypothetical protein
MHLHRKVLATAAAGIVATGAYAGVTSAHDGPGHGDGHGGRHGSVTGFPETIAKVDLSGYKLVTNYSLGRNTGNVFQQDYGSGTVSAVGLKGPFTGQGFTSKYIAMPVGHHKLMITWYLDDGTLTDVFVMNFDRGIVSDVAPAPAPESLGTVTVLQTGTNPIP